MTPLKLAKPTPIKTLAYLIGIALLISPVFRFSWDLGTQTFIHILILASFLIAVNFFRPHFNRSKEMLLLLFILSVLLGIIKAPEKATFRNEFLILLDCIVVAYIFRYLPKEIKIQLLHIPVLVGSWFTIVMCVYFIFNPIRYLLADVLPPEFMINYNIVAGYLTLCLPISFVLWENNKKLPFFISILLFTGIVLTKSRAAILTSFIISIYYIFFIENYSKKYLVYALIIIFSLLSLLTYFKFRKYPLPENIFLSDRFLWWKSSWNIFKKNLLIGIGWGNFRNVFLYYKTAPGQNTIFAHNSILQLLAETGLLGFITFLLVLFSFLKEYINSMKLYQLNRINTPIFLAVLGFLFINFFDYSFYVPASMLLFWICLGALSSLSFEYRNKRVFPLWLLIVFILFLSYPAIRIYLGSFYYSKGVKYLINKQTDKSEEYLIKSIQTDPLLSASYSKMATTYFLKYKEDKSKQHLEKAIMFENKAIDRFRYNPVYWSDLAWLNWFLDNKQQAVNSIITAIEYDKFNKNYQKTLNFYYRKTDRQ